MQHDPAPTSAFGTQSIPSFRVVETMPALGARSGDDLARSLKPGGEPSSTDGPQGSFAWRIERDGDRVQVLPSIVRPRKEGADRRIRRLHPVTASAQSGAFAMSADRDLLSAMNLCGYFRGAEERSDDAVRALRSAFLMLVGHDNVIDGETGEPVSVVARAATLAVVNQPGGARLVPRLGDERLVRSEARALVEAWDQGPVVHFDPNGGQLQVVTIDDWALAGLRAMLWSKSAFEGPASERLIGTLLPLAQGRFQFRPSGPGEERSACTRMLVCFTWDGALKVRLLMRPALGGALAVPGTGDKVWYGQDDDGLVIWCRRDHEAEAELARPAWRAVIGENAGEGCDGFTAYFRDIEAAMDVVDRAKHLLASPDSQIEVVWEGDEWAIPQGADFDELKFRVAGNHGFFQSRVDVQLDDDVVMSLAQLMDVIREKRRYVPVAGVGWRKINKRLRNRLATLPWVHTSDGQLTLPAPVLRDLAHDRVEVIGDDRWLALADAVDAARRWVDGATPASARKSLVERFQAGEVDVFLLSTLAAGVGLNLTRAPHVFHMDPWWNPAVEDQATDRAHRIGQTEPVTVYRFVTAATVEDAVYRMHASKRELAQALVGGPLRPSRCRSTSWRGCSSNLISPRARPQTTIVLSTEVSNRRRPWTLPDDAS